MTMRLVINTRLKQILDVIRCWSDDTTEAVDMMRRLVVKSYPFTPKRHDRLTALDSMTPRTLRKS
jgi:hypothetical protein